MAQTAGKSRQRVQFILKLADGLTNLARLARIIWHGGYLLYREFA
jgi:hypothetical protein